MFEISRNGRFYRLNVIPREEFDYAKETGEFCVVCKDEKWNFVDANGNYLSPIWFFSVLDFSPNGLAKVLISSSEMNYLKRDGTFLFPTHLFYVEHFRDELAVIKRHGDFASTVVDSNGNQLIDWQSFIDISRTSRRIIARSIDYEWNLYDFSGKKLTSVSFEYISSFCESRAVVKDKNGKYGFIDEDGNLISPIVFDECEPFSDGMAAVRVNDKWGFIDRNGKLVASPEYDSVQSFEAGFAFVIKNQLGTFIDQNGRAIFPFLFKSSSRIGKMRDFAIALFPDEKFNILHLPSRRILLQSPVENIYLISDETRYVIISVSQRRFIFDLETQRVSFHSVESVFDSCSVSQTATVKVSGKWNIFDYQTFSFVSKEHFHACKNFNRSAIAPVKKNENSKWSFIDRAGNPVEIFDANRQPIEFYSVEPIACGFFRVSFNKTPTLYNIVDGNQKRLVFSAGFKTTDELESAFAQYQDICDILELE